MFRQYRPIQKGEFFICAGDTSQGGKDGNFMHFISKSKLDIPLVYERQGVAAEMTAEIHPVIERISDTTGVIPLVCLERNNGGASEMQRLQILNREQKYRLFTMPTYGLTHNKDTNKLGWDTNTATRPDILGSLLHVINNNVILIYDEETLKQLKSFIVNSQGKPIGAPGKRDDAVMSLAIGVKLLQTVNTPSPYTPMDINNFDNFQIGEG